MLTIILIASGIACYLIFTVLTFAILLDPEDLTSPYKLLRVVCVSLLWWLTWTWAFTQGLLSSPPKENDDEIRLD